MLALLSTTDVFILVLGIPIALGLIAFGAALLRSDKGGGA